jgi:hypothetical protein
MNWTLYPAAQFEDFQDRWQALNLAGAASPLLDREFVRPLLKEFGGGKEILACCQHDGRMQAMAIIVPAGRMGWETLQPSQSPLGLWIQRPGLDTAQLLSALTGKLPGFPLLLGITQQDPQLLPRPRDGGAIKTLDYIQTARIQLDGGFDDYWNARGKNLRQNMKKQRSKLEKEGVTLRLQLSTAPEDVVPALADYGALEGAGWKARLGTAIHPDNAQGRFYRNMLEAFCARGAGRIYRYWYGDRVVAMDLCVEGNGTLIILKTTYDESIKDGTSPAFLLRQEQTTQLFDDANINSIEFYGKVMDWHLKWTGDVRTMYHMNNYRFSLLSRAHGAIRKGAPVLAQPE